MKYMLLIHEEEARLGKMAVEERASFLAEYRTLIDELKGSGAYQAGSQLQPTATATSVRVRNGKRLVTDGPFAETREQLGGYFLVEAADLDAAIAIAERIPSARFGTIEVRPVVAVPAPAPA
jgi:hypothetical protein